MLSGAARIGLLGDGEMAQSVRRLLLVLLCLSSSIPFAWSAAAYELCGIDPEQFRQFAFPSEVPFMGDRLAKRSSSPGLIVLSDQESDSIQNKAIFDQIRKDDLGHEITTRFIRYQDASEIRAAVQEFGTSNVFIIVDDDAFSGQSSALRQAIQNILPTPAIVDRLLLDAKGTQRFSIQTHSNFATGQLFGTVVLVNPALGQDVVRSVVYAFYYAGVSPSATYQIRDFFSLMFDVSPEGRPNALSDFGRSYYRIILDTELPFGTAATAIKDCSR